MKKTLIYLALIILVPSLVKASEPERLYQIKATAIYGNILKHTRHLQNIVDGPTRGIEIDYEMFTNHHTRDWHGFFNFPKFGIGSVWLNLGNDEMLGDLFALYPYLNFSMINTSFFRFNIKAGAGASYLTKTFNNAQFVDNNGHIILNQSNAAIGSKLNVWFVGGANLEIPIIQGISLVGGAHWNHASNGSVMQPNSGLNMINISAGLSFFPGHKNYYKPVERKYADLERKTGVEFILSGGVKELYFRDELMFPTGALTINLYRQLSNRLRLGIAADGFYNGAYASVNSSNDPSQNISTFKFTYLTEDKLINRFRAGVSLQPEFIFGRLTAGFHFGLYLFNPIKNLEPYNDAKAGPLNKPLIYPYDIEKEHGWLYTRAAVKYLINKNLFAYIGLKTHLQKAEFIEWGLGVRL